MKTAICLMAAALPLAAQPKLLINAQVHTQSAASGLEGQYKALLTAQPQPMWIGYSVPSVRSYNLGCDYVRDGFNQPGVVHLEPPDHAVILFRIENNQLNRIRTLSPDCEIDAGGVPVHWLTDVQPAQSVALLVSLMADRDRIGESPITAIAQHADPAAEQALERFLDPNQPETLRLRAVSAIGNTRGRRGYDLLKKLIANDPDERVRERAISSLSSSREPDSQDLLISIATTDKNARMRQQAVSALARRPGTAAVSTITKVIESDPDLQVKRHAVSALNQVPDGAGIPVLIQMVKTTQNAEVRKQAMNTLQNSRDPRAVAFFEDVLKH
ncbi:MAG TPA: HEAT repeat domain-containing protein [Bryobacteraceae bacterium]|nr:HEAT repeat domain-containing protein [Bryobacteraceae bacterium]